MKKINKLTLGILVLAVTTQLSALSNIADFSPHSYGLNHVSAGITPATIIDKESFGAGFSLHSKTSLKNIHYKKGEFFWDGSVSYSFMDKSLFDQSNSDFKLDLNTGLGYSTNINRVLLTSIAGGIGYLDYTMDNTINDSSVNRYSSPYVYLESGLGLNTHNMMGAIYKLSYGNFTLNNSNKEMFFKHNLKFPLHFNYGPNASFVLSPEFEYIKLDSISNKRFLLNFEFSWLYR